MTTFRRWLTAGFTGLVLCGGPAAAVAQPGVPGAADSVSVRAVPARSVVRPGDQLPLAVVFEHARGFHSWPHEPVLPPAYEDVVPIPTDIEIGAVPEGIEAGAIQWPEPIAVTVRYTGFPVELLSYVDKAVAYVPLEVDPALEPGRREMELRATVQACDEEVCYFPKTVHLTVPLRVATAAEGPTAANEPDLFSGFSYAAFRGGQAEWRPTMPAYINVFGWSFSFTPGGAAGVTLLLLLGALGGLLLNLTPCVLPLIPIKVMGLRSAAGDPSRMLRLGAAMTLGVAAFWLALGGAVAFVSGFDAISSLFQTGWFSPVVGVVVAVAGLGMLGLVQVRLPQAVYGFDPDRETLPGSFGFGVMIAVLSTPCTAPFMAGAAAWAALQPPPLTLGTFAAIGAGMALPYLALSARPGLVNRIPRSGEAGVLIKQVMGLLMLAVAAFFLGSGFSGFVGPSGDWASRGYWWVVGLFIVAAFGWLAYRTLRISGSPLVRRSVVFVSVLATGITLVTAGSLAGPGPVDWVPYSPERFEEVAERGDVVVMDFTAEWCLNCKALESGVLHREPVAGLLNGAGVVPMRIDLTGDNAEGRAKLQELGWVGIPLLAVFGPGTGYETPIKYDSYTPAMVRRAVETATNDAQGPSGKHK